MTRMEQAAADLRTAKAALNAYVPYETLQNAVEIAEKAVLSAALGSRPSEGMLNELESADDIAANKDEMLEGLTAEKEASDTFSEDAIEADGADEQDDPYSEGLESFDGAEVESVIFDEAGSLSAETFGTGPSDHAEGNLKEVSATAADVVEAINEAIPNETIDATEEVSVEEAKAANPNGQLGANWPNTAA